MKLFVLFSAVLLTVSTAPHTDNKLIQNGRNSFELETNTELPDYVNWVERGAVTSVKDQGKCGSCYSFSAAGALEGLIFLKNKTLTNVSEQELVDCSRIYGNFGCDGGNMSPCFQYVEDRPGIDDLSSYPYVAKENNKCLASQGKIAGYCTDYTLLPEGDEEIMRRAVATVGPISVAIAVSHEFETYTSGIYNGTCADDLNHAVLIVGYGTDDQTKKDYWLVKNSWGTKWGDKGYIKMLRNVNLCGIASNAVYPIYSV